jgi:hypothetical protein
MIVECKCQKYKFDIPNLEIPEEGRMVRCGFCDEEWLYRNTEPLKDLNPSEEILIPKEKKKIVVKTINYTTLLSFIFFIIILFISIYSNKELVLQKFPIFFGFFEASDILKEIISQNFNWLIETIKN